MKSVVIILLGLALAFSSCKKDPVSEPLPPISETPTVSVVSVTPSSVAQYRDQVVFKILFNDGNGDIGETDPDIESLFLIDDRDPENLINTYHISPRAPLDANIAIQGTLDVVLGNTVQLNQSNVTETTTFTCYIIDRAGNKSNEAKSPEVTITK